jgi:MarR family transcriptional regulator, negative regulator of the multidrug operon emrRAB
MCRFTLQDLFSDSNLRHENITCDMVSWHMSEPAHLDVVVASLTRLKERIPQAPISKILLSRLLVELGRGMSGRLELAIRPFGLAEPEFRVLTVLFSQPEGIAHPSELCARTAQSPANMSRIADALVSRDLITRVSSTKDRRRMVLRITEQGEELVRHLMPALFAPLEALLAEFTSAELDQLVALLARLFERLARAAEPPAA